VSVPSARPARATRSSGTAKARYRATLDRLFQLRRFGMRPGLEVIDALLGALDHPEASFRAVHVAGSKGKGSVSAMTARILEEAGRKVGLFTSPHLVSYRERIRVRGRPIPRAAVVEGIERIQARADSLARDGRIDRHPTFFEITTALAFDWFRTAEVDDAVIEVGLGGRLDSTNVLSAPVGVISTIELEHTEILGPTLTDIAREKAGILHPGMRAVIGEVGPEAGAEIARSADRSGVPVLRLGREIRVADRTLSEGGQTFSVETPRNRYPKVEIPLQGSFQPGNAALAIAASELYANARGFDLPTSAVLRGLATVRWPGRLERLARRPETYVDVAHTPESARAVAESLAELLPFADPSESVVLFGCLADKRIDRILEALSPLARTVVVVPVGSARSAAPADLRRSATGRFARIVQAPDAGAGLALARAAVGPDGFLLATGSDYLVGEILRQARGRSSGEPDLSDPGLSGEPPAAAGRPGKP